MLSEIPPRQRTDFVMKIIQKQINRFVELRSEFSRTQKDDSISIEPKTHGANNKSLKDSLATLQNNVGWIVPIVQTHLINMMKKHHQLIHKK